MKVHLSQSKYTISARQSSLLEARQGRAPEAVVYLVNLSKL